MSHGVICSHVCSINVCCALWENAFIIQQLIGPHLDYHLAFHSRVANAEDCIHLLTDSFLCLAFAVKQISKWWNYAKQVKTNCVNPQGPRFFFLMSSENWWLSAGCNVTRYASLPTFYHLMHCINKTATQSSLREYCSLIWTLHCLKQYLPPKVSEG